MEQFLLSIVIPTRNRQFYCKQVIKQVLNNTTDKTQIVIQDNSDTDELNAFVTSLNNQRVTYNYNSTLLSFVDNFSEALEFARGQYVCMIGDDDGILPNIESVAHYALTNKIDVIVPGLNSVYVWPSPKPIVKGAEEGYLALMFIKNRHHNGDTKKAVKDLLKNGFQDYQQTEMPRLYHGLVSYTALERIKKKIGTYFGGLTPDMYMSVALSQVINKVDVFEYPITISGICPKSGSSASATGDHTGKLEDAPHFKGHQSYEWDRRVPAVYSVETIWADTGLHALRDFDQDNIVDGNSLANIYSRIWRKYPQFRDEVQRVADINNVSIVKIKTHSNLLEVSHVVKRISTKIFRKPSSVAKYYDVKDINQAMKITCEMLRRAGIEL